jgi:hypothetical protein
MVAIAIVISRFMTCKGILDVAECVVRACALASLEKR